MSTNKKLVIAIDGYSSCGKSTLAKDLAKNLKYKYVNSGAMYRVATYIAMQNKLFPINKKREESLVKILENSYFDFKYNYILNRFETILNEKCIEDKIQSFIISEKVSPLAKIKAIRKCLVEKQRNVSSSAGIVMEGRDIGTVVLPKADLKIFMTADVRVRAKRRFLEWQKKDQNITLQQVINNISKRDKLDEERAESPLKKAKDSIVLDNSNLSLQEQLEWALNEVKKKLSKKNKQADIFIDQSAGYCFGVTKAISKAEEELQKEDKLLVIGHIVHNSVETNRLIAKGFKAISKAEEELQKEDKLLVIGHIVHNSVETNRLIAKGLRPINHKEFANIKDTKVLIRAHGEPPSTYAIAKKNNISLIDQSCPIVLNVQKKLKKIYEENKDAQVVLYGKKGHPEILGLLGQINNNAIVIENKNQSKDIDKLDFTKPIILFSQTTKSAKGYNELAEVLQDRSKEDIKIVDTICRIVSNRVPKLRDFARKHDVILFVSDKKSSNGNLLFQISKKENSNSHFISNTKDLDFTWFKNAKTIGISGATSTPEWLIKDIYASIKNKINCTE